jgi:transposase-like protein
MAKCGTGTIATDNTVPGCQMIAVRSPKCGSPQLVKNGRRSTGQQKYHGKECRCYGTLDTYAVHRQDQGRLVEQLHTERVSQRWMARITGGSRTTVIKWPKKDLDDGRTAATATDTTRRRDG